jgi:hypothetical protein
MLVTKSEEVDVRDVLECCDTELPEPASYLIEVDIEVNVTGEYRPAILFPVDKAQPAEHPEPEAKADENELAMKLLTFYGMQVKLTADEAISFLRAAKVKCANLITAATIWAVEQDAPEPPERDDFEDADHWQHN